MAGPTLFKAFYKIRPKSFDYCCVCLRTGGERRLVKPRHFKKFIFAIFHDIDFNEKNQVCYMCERQASMAYKFYKAATFANTVKNFLKEYLDIRNKGTSEAFEKRQFRLLLKKNYEWESSGDLWESQLQKIRSSTELLQTEVLVIDSAGAPSVVPRAGAAPPQSLPELYIVPDRLPEPPAEPPSQADNIILIDEDEERQQIVGNQENKGPKLVPIQKLLEGSPSPSIGQPPTTSGLMATAPSVSEFVTTISAGDLQLMPSTDGLSTTNKTTTPPSITGVNENYILHPIVLAMDGSMTVPTLGSNLLYNVIPMPQSGNNNLIQINNTDSATLNLINNNNTYQVSQSSNHSNLLQGGAEKLRLNVQMADNNNYYFQLPQITNNGIANANNPKQVLQIEVSDNAAIEPDMNNTQPTMHSEHMKQINDLANEIISEIENFNTDNSNDSPVNNKPSNTINNFGIKRPGGVMTPVIQDVHSIDKKKKTESDNATRKSERIDWEDKIPMDVISFVDAIDPNADQILTTKPSPQYAISHVRSLTTPEKRKNKSKMNSVIDLC